MNDKKQQIRIFIREEIARIGSEKGQPVLSLEDDFNFVHAGLLDSYGFINLVMSIEDKFDVQVDFGDMEPEEFPTLGGLLRSVAA